MEANGGNVRMDAFNKGKALAPQSRMGSGGMNPRPSGVPPHGQPLNDEDGVLVSDVRSGSAPLRGRAIRTTSSYQ